MELFQSTPARGGRLLALRHARRRQRVSIHARTRRATAAGKTTPTPGARFQSTPARGGRPGFPRRNRGGFWFQSTPARGGRPTQINGVGTGNVFQSTPARGGRPNLTNAPTAGDRFNPRPHAAGDVQGLGRSLDSTVSIHARTRRATVEPRFNRASLSFQSTPARGGRRGLLQALAPGDRFNPRPHAAGDGRSFNDDPRRLCFNPRPHAAGDMITQFFRKRFLRFQSTPARGGRRNMLICEYCGQREFQSTPARGGRHHRSADCAVHAWVSIHARTRRATAAVWSVVTSQLFQSTPARGGRPTARRKSAPASKFQSTPARGGRQGLRRSRQGGTGFSIHARTRRATPRRWGLSQTCFNPRPHAAGDGPPLFTPNRHVYTSFNPRPLAAVDPVAYRETEATPEHARRQEVSETANPPRAFRQHSGFAEACSPGGFPKQKRGQKSLRCAVGVKTSLSGNQRAFRIIALFRTDMLNPPLPIAAQEIVAKTVLVQIDLLLRALPSAKPTSPDRPGTQRPSSAPAGRGPRTPWPCAANGGGPPAFAR